MSWMIFYVKPRTEKKMADYSDIYSTEYYLPLREETKVYQRRKVTVSKPMFPCYFFASAAEEARVRLLQTNHVLKIIEPTNEAKLLHELDQIRKALAVDPTLGSTNALAKGIRIRIMAGPFQGIEGVVHSLKGNGLVRLNVEMIGQAVAVTIDKDFLERIG